MKQICILSGKGGTGKTTITGSFAALSKNAVFADCDVDAANLHLILQPESMETMEFKGLKLASINEDKCIQCSRCEDNCRFNAINNYKVDPIHCEGCKVCVIVCPVNAVNFIDRVCGYAYISQTKYGPLSHADLIPGMENSGKLVTLVRQNAKKLAENEGYSYVIVDGPPGVGCPVIASLADIDFSLAVVEPTLSGIHDLKRALQLLDHFNIEPLVCVNKYDLNQKNTSNIVDFCFNNQIDIIGRVPFDSNVTKAMVNGQPVVEYAPESPASKSIVTMWGKVKERLL